MRITLAVLVVASLLAVGQPASAKVVATTIRLYMQTLDPSKLTYKVPSGSVFILQHVGFSIGWTQPRVIQIVPPGGDKFYSTVELTFAKSFNTLDRDLKLPAGTTITSVNSMTLEECILFGVLAEESDLYAAMDCELTAPSLAGGYLSADLVMDSPRPAVVAAQSRADLVKDPWREEPDAVTPTTERRVYKVEVSAGAGESKFVRVSARARQTDD